MRLVVQRVTHARVEVERAIVGSIQKGVLVLVGIHKDDQREQGIWLAQKLLNLRMFSDAEEKMNLSLREIKGELLIVSQFTLYANCSEGRRPSFVEAAPPDRAQSLYQEFVSEVTKSGLLVQTGIFGAKMQVHLENDGPVTFLLEK